MKIKRSSRFWALLILLSAFLEPGRADQAGPSLDFWIDYRTPPKPGNVPPPSSNDPFLNPPSQPATPPAPPPADLRNIQQSIRQHQAQLQKLFEESRQQTSEYFSAVARIQAEQAAAQALEFERYLSESEVKATFTAARRSNEIRNIDFSPNFIRYQISENKRQLSRFEERWANPNQTRPSAQQIDAAILGGALTFAAEDALERNEIQPAAMAARVGQIALDIALDLTPVVGNIKGLVEGISGRSLLTGEKLSTFQRTLALTSAIPFGAIAKGLRTGLPAMTEVFAEGSKAAVEGERLAKAFGKTNMAKALSADEAAAKIAKAVESKVDNLEAFFRTLKPAQLEDIAKGMGNPHAYEQMLSSAKKIEGILGEQAAVDAFMKMDPAVAVKTLQDISDAERLGMSLKAYEGNSEALLKYFDKAETLNKKLLSGEPTNIFVKVDNASTFMAAKSGEVLETKLTREIPYLSNGRSGEVLSAAQGRRFSFVASEEQALAEFSSGLKKNEVSAVLSGELRTAELFPRQVRLYPSTTQLGEINGHLSDEALKGLQYAGDESRGIKFVGANGKLAEFGSAGDRYAKPLKDIEAYSTPQFNVKKSFQAGDAQKVLCPKGEVLMQAQRHAQPWTGTYFSPTRALNPDHANQLSNIYVYENWARQQKAYVAKENINGFYGKVTGGSGDQFWVPDFEVINGQAINVPMTDLFFELRF